MTLIEYGAGISCREVVTHNVDDLLVVPVCDDKALADAIARLQGDSALHIRLAEAGRRNALEQFDEKIVVRHRLRL